MTMSYPQTNVARNVADARRVRKLFRGDILNLRGCVRVAALGFALSAATHVGAQLPPGPQTPPTAQAQPPAQSTQPGQLAPPEQSTPPAQATPPAQTPSPAQTTPPGQATSPAQATPSAQAAPPAQAPAAVQTPPAAAAPASASESDELPGKVWGNYLVHQSVEFGYRDSMIGGNQNNYDTFENLQSGMRLFNFSVGMLMRQVKRKV